MTLQLDMFSSAPRESMPAPALVPKTIAGRFRAFDSANPHVLAEMLRLARARLARGETYISVKALWEELRVSLAARGVNEETGEYKLNNNYTALYARRLIEIEPRLESAIRIRRRKSK